MISKKRVFAALPRTERGNNVVLGEDPKGKRFLYTNGNSVVMRDLRSPQICDIYTEHSFQTTVAKYSPSGFYICSADVTGKIRIWDTVNDEHVLKAEYQPFVGTVKDLAWSHDSQRLVVVGEGREKFGAVINMETGTTLGEISGHSKRINTVDFSKKRPFKILTGSDDNCIGVYEGPPFKFKNQIEEHKKYVQVVRFSPDNTLFASGGFDGKVLVFKTDSSEKIAEFDAHKGVVNGLSWGPNSNEIFTCAAGDKCVRLFDVNTAQVKEEFVVGSELGDQQVGCLWPVPDILLSVSLSGQILFFDHRLSGGVARAYRGHNKPITAMALNEQVLVGGCDGSVSGYPMKDDGEVWTVFGGHSNQIVDLFEGSDCVYSLGFDDLLKRIVGKEFDPEFQFKLDSQPRGGAAASVNGEELLVIACYQHVLLLTNSPALLERHEVIFEPNAVAICPEVGGETIVAIGGAKDKKVHLYQLQNGRSLVEISTTEPLLHRDAITTLKFSPNGRFLAAGDANRKVVVYDREQDWSLAHQVDWGNHSARVMSLDWLADSQRIVSGSLDTSLCLWDMNNLMKPVQLRKAHPLSAVNKVRVTSNGEIVSAGQDANLKQWVVC